MDGLMDGRQMDEWIERQGDEQIDRWIELWMNGP